MKEKFYRGKLRRRMGGRLMFEVLVYSEDGICTTLGHGYRWGDKAGAELEAGSDLLAHALILDATGEAEQAVQHYRHVARLKIDDLDDYWIMSSTELLDFLQKLEAAAGQNKAKRIATGTNNGGQ